MARWGVALVLVGMALVAAPAGAATWQSTAVPFGGQTEDALLSAAPDGTFYARRSAGRVS